MQMRVTRFMQTNVITIPSDTLITDAQRIMQENDVRRLPVVDKGKLVGIITRTRLRDAAPSVATSLSTWELQYLLSKITVKDVMEQNVLTIAPDTAVEEAAAIMAEKRIGAMPVMQDGRLVGIITATDLFRLLIDVLGVRQPGARVQIEEPYKDKPFGSISQVFAEHHVKILSVFTFTDPQTHCQDMVIRTDTEDAAFIARVMKENGFTVVDEG
jgi:acetoin utilization protein AcuB